MKVTLSGPLKVNGGQGLRARIRAAGKALEGDDKQTIPSEMIFTEEDKAFVKIFVPYYRLWTTENYEKILVPCFI